MVAPLTGFETDGTFTSLAHEETFLQTVAAETDAVYSVAGLSEEGRAMHRLDVGNPTGTTWFIYTLVHADEKDAREAVLAFVRDIAYSVDPGIIDYRATCRIVLITPMNPDGLNAGIRNKPNGVDINKDHIKLVSPEAQVAQNTLHAVGPHMALDAHERFGTKAFDIEYFPTGTLAIHPDLRAASDDICAAIVTAMTAASYTVGEYPSPGRISGREAAAFHHCASFLLETFVNDHGSISIPFYTTALEAARAWHQANTAQLTAAKAASIAAATANQPVPYILQTGDLAGGGNWPQTALPDTLIGYQVHDPLPTAQMDAYGVVADGTTVSMAQAARAIIPMLFDPESGDGLGISATRILDTPDTGSGLIGMRVRAQGESRPVIGMRYGANGLVYDVLLPWET